jgi:hypothetical protein
MDFFPPRDLPRSLIPVFFVRPGRSSRRLAAIAVAAVLALTVAGCDAADTSATESGSTPLTSTAAQPTSAAPAGGAQSHLTDYSRLLLQAADLSDSSDTFTERSSATTPNGVPGASRLFVNADDTRAISATVAVYPGAPTAEATLREAIATSGTVLIGGQPQPLGVGTAGTMIKGASPSGDKAITLVLFTHDNVLARLEFDSAAGDATTDDFVTSIAKMQHIALRMGISDRTE